MAEQHVGEIIDRRHSFGDPTALKQLLEEGQFEDAQAETLTRRMRCADAGAFLRMNAQALVGISTASSTMSDDERARQVDLIAKASAEAVRGQMHGDQ